MSCPSTLLSLPVKCRRPPHPGCDVAGLRHQPVWFHHPLRIRPGCRVLRLRLHDPARDLQGWRNQRIPRPCNLGCVWHALLVPPGLVGVEVETVVGERVSNPCCWWTAWQWSVYYVMDPFLGCRQPTPCQMLRDLEGGCMRDMRDSRTYSPLSPLLMHLSES